VHESAHAAVAWHFGLTVELLTLDFARIPHRHYHAPDDRDSIERLIVSASGDCATTHLLQYPDTGRDGWVPAQALLVLIKDILEKGDKLLNAGQNPDWTHIRILRNIDPKEIGNTLSGSQYSVQFASKYLALGVESIGGKTFTQSGEYL
jgi:hypothetical protein